MAGVPRKPIDPRDLQRVQVSGARQRARRLVSVLAEWVERRDLSDAPEDVKFAEMADDAFAAFVGVRSRRMLDLLDLAFAVERAAGRPAAPEVAAQLAILDYSSVGGRVVAGTPFALWVAAVESWRSSGRSGRSKATGPRRMTALVALGRSLRLGPPTESTLSSMLSEARRRMADSGLG